jgi:MarR family transcriptional regulator, organic hydroperoxide resistance regulator
VTPPTIAAVPDARVATVDQVADHSAERDAVIEDARLALSDLLAAERRLRARDMQRRDRTTYAQSRALLALASEGRGAEIPAGQLARAADLHPATVTGMLDGLEEAGLVSRRRSETDRRSVLVALTPEGTLLLESKRVQWHDRWVTLLEEIGDADIQTATRVMHQLAAVFSEL